MGFYLEFLRDFFQNHPPQEWSSRNPFYLEGNPPHKDNPSSTNGNLAKILHQAQSGNPSPQQRFFNDHAHFAILTQKYSGIPASVTLAQAALESGFGRHAPGNNYFGIKGKGPAGSQLLKTWEVKNGKRVRVQAKFRKYHSPLESFLDHANVIAHSRYLKHAMEHTESAKSFINALQSKKTKYATDPNYVTKIMKIIQTHQLKKFDSYSRLQPPLTISP